MRQRKSSNTTSGCKPENKEPARVEVEFLGPSNKGPQFFIQFAGDRIYVICAEGSFAMPRLPRTFDEFSDICLGLLRRRAPTIFQQRWASVVEDAREAGLLATGRMRLRRKY
ncbi:hypothetical protein IQ26_02918 [Mesorhizobium tianshanense]|uniref:Uncharacterized protein n=2 Tax=Mesorhizobium tianshanense TaxID=39844 RepID=A0A562NW52_9HYPH|nr:hypothetical protein IQ26_02918 [Mesorhizobium tianshanense]